MGTDYMRWARINMSGEAIVAIARNAREYLPETGRYNIAPNVGAMYRTDISVFTGIVFLHHLQAPNPPGEGGAVFARKAAQVSVRYFFGDWRKAYATGGERWNEAECRRRWNWYDEYRCGLLCALVVDEEPALAEILRWPEEDLPHDGGAWDAPREENYFQSLLALTLRQANAAGQQRLREQIVGGRRVRPKLLVQGLDAIYLDDASGFLHVLEKLLAYHLKHEFQPDNDFRAILHEGSILFHVARRRGVTLPPLPANLQDRIVTAETIA